MKLSAKLKHRAYLWEKHSSAWLSRRPDHKVSDVNRIAEISEGISMMIWYSKKLKIPQLVMS